MRIKTSKPSLVDPDMTPMIDIVFQLIIFFMIVSEFQSMELEQITLPFALESHVDPHTDRRMIVNVNSNGEKMVMRRRYTDEQLSQLIAHRARLLWDHADNVSNLAVKIRADAECEYKHVQHLMTKCMHTGVWRVSFGTNQAENERTLDF